MKLLHTFTGDGVSPHIPEGLDQGRQAFIAILGGGSLTSGTISAEVSPDDGATYYTLEGYSSLTLPFMRKIQFPGRLRFRLASSSGPNFQIYYDIMD